MSAEDNDGLKDWDQTDEAIMRRLEREHERKVAKAQAAQQAMTRTLAAGLKEELTKQALAKELLGDLRDDEGDKSRRLRKYQEVHGMGAVSAFEARENRYWEQDE